jgi:hypothetical protein
MLNVDIFGTHIHSYQSWTLYTILGKGTSQPLGRADDSLRQRSAFCITVIMMVISQVQDGGNGLSTLTKQCRQHAEHMGTYFVLFHGGH